MKQTTHLQTIQTVITLEHFQKLETKLEEESAFHLVRKVNQVFHRDRKSIKVTIRHSKAELRSSIIQTKLVLVKTVINLKKTKSQKDN